MPDVWFRDAAWIQGLWPMLTIDHLFILVLCYPIFASIYMLGATYWSQLTYKPARLRYGRKPEHPKKTTQSQRECPNSTPAAHEDTIEAGFLALRDTNSSNCTTVLPTKLLDHLCTVKMKLDALNLTHLYIPSSSLGHKMLTFCTLGLWVVSISQSCNRFLAQIQLASNFPGPQLIRISKETVCLALLFDWIKMSR